MRIECCLSVKGEGVCGFGSLVGKGGFIGVGQGVRARIGMI